MIYAYVRVSTESQTVENQKFEINNFVDKHNLVVSYWVVEQISGTLDFEKRKLGTIIKKIKKGDILICSEISRLGRSILQIMTFLNVCMQKEVMVWTIKDNYRLGSDIQSKVLAFAFSLSAEIERNLISQRTKEALNRIKSEGRKLGRKVGSKNKHHVLDGKKELIEKLLEQKIPKTKIARRMNVSVVTLYKFLNGKKRKSI